MNEILAIVPARGGSRGIPNKNIALVGGQPLIYWTIAAARAAASIQRIVVSTDSPAIAEIARRCGAETPFLRPPELAQDDTPGLAPILHAVRWLAEHEGYRPEWVMCLQPTSPLRTAGDIEAAVELARRKRADAVVSVAPLDHHPYWIKQVDEEGRLHDFLTGDHPSDRRQDAPPLYALNGAIYLARRDVLLERESWYTGQTYACVMPVERSLDVDTPWDLHLADLILGARP